MDAELAFLCSMLTGAMALVAIFVSIVSGVGLAGRISLLERRLMALQKKLDERSVDLPLVAPATEASAVEPSASTPPGEASEVDSSVGDGEGTGPDETPAVADDDGETPDAPGASDDVVPDAEPSAPGATPEPLAARWRLSPERIAVWLAVMIGGFMVIVGVLFALVTIAQTGLLGPGVRVALALVGGTGLWVGGSALRGRLRAVPAALEGVGMSMLLGALFAAHVVYGFLPGAVTFGGFVAVSAVAGLRAGVIGDRVMAYLGLVGALLAPVVVSSGNNGALALFSYLGLLACGFTFMATRRRWPDLIGTTVVGMGALFAGWTVSWYVAESVWMAHLGAVVLAVPFAVAAGSVHGEDTADQLTRWTAALAALVWSVLVLPWVVPVDAHFTDPRSYLTVVRPGPMLAELSVLTPALLGVPLALAARRRRDPWFGALAVVASTLPAFVAAVGWGALEVDAHVGSGVAAIPWLLAPLDVALAASLLPVLAFGLLFAGDRRAGIALPLSLAPALWVGAGLAATAFGARWAALSFAVTLLAAITAQVSTRGYVLLAGLAVQAVVMAVAAVQVADLGVLWVVGPALFTLGVMPFVSLAPRWPDPLPGSIYLAGVLAPAVVFPPLFAAWTEAWGWGAIGVLPVLLGTVSLLGTGVLLRRHELDRTEPLVGVALLVTLAGVTFAVPLQLESQWLTVGWALEALAVAAVARWAPQFLLRGTAVALGVTVAIRLLLNPWALSYGDAGGWPILNWTLYTWGVPTLCLVGIASLLGESTLSRISAVTLRILAMFTGFALVNVQVSHAFQDAGPIELGGHTLLQGMVRSLSWGAFGLFLLGLGLGLKSRYTRFFGFAFILLAAVKVLIFDIWTLPGFVRVGSLVGLGAILLISALLFERLVLREDK